MKRIKLVSGVVAALAMYAMATAGAASGTGAPGGLVEFAYCDPMAPAGAILGRGGEVREPDLGEVHADLPGAAKGRAGKRFRTTMPLYFHVVTDGPVGALTNAQIA